MLKLNSCSNIFSHDVGLFVVNYRSNVVFVSPHTFRFVGLRPILIHRTYRPKFLKLEKSIKIEITRDYQASDENESCGRAISHSFDISSCFDILSSTPN